MVLNMEIVQVEESATHEPSTEQTTNGDFGEATGHHENASLPSLDPDGSTFSMKGASTTTYIPPKLKRKSADENPKDSATSVLEFGDFEETEKVYTLQPIDGGFGAWSYAASAFAMFIVVWGELSPVDR